MRRCVWSLLILLGVTLLTGGCEPTPPPKPPEPLNKIAPPAIQPAVPPPAPQPAPAPAVQPVPQSAPQPETPPPAAAPVVADKGKELLATACNTQCHNLDRVTGYHEKTPWKDIVDRMIAKHGAKATTEEAAAITDHLNKTYPIKQE